MFEVGQRVRCVNKAGWILAPDNHDSDGPSYGEVSTVTRGSVMTKYGDCIGVSGSSGLFLAKCFRPLTEDPKAVKRTVERHFSKFLKEPVKEGV